MALLIKQSDVQSFREDGVVILRGVFKEWIDILANGADFHLNNPSEQSLVHQNEKYSRVNF